MRYNITPSEYSGKNNFSLALGDAKVYSLLWMWHRVMLPRAVTEGKHCNGADDQSFQAETGGGVVGLRPAVSNSRWQIRIERLSFCGVQEGVLVTGSDLIVFLSSLRQRIIVSLFF